MYIDVSTVESEGTVTAAYRQPRFKHIIGMMFAFVMTPYASELTAGTEAFTCMVSRKWKSIT